MLASRAMAFIGAFEIIGSSSAFAVTLPDPIVGGNLGFSNCVPGCQNNPTTPGSYSNSVSGQGVSGQSTLSISATPTPNMSASMSESVSHYAIGSANPVGSISGISAGSYSYQFMISGPQPSVLVDVSSSSLFNIGSVSSDAVKTVTANSSLQISGSNVALNRNASFFYNGFTGDVTSTSNISGTTSSGFSGGFSGLTAISFDTNSVYTLVLQLTVAASLSTSPGSIQLSGFIDPFMSIDPTVLDPNSYHFDFSPTIGNAPITATPLPAALPLFATGLGLLGWLAKRRNRKAAALAAA